MSIFDNNRWPEYLNKCGNVYCAVNALSNDARMLMHKYNDRISDTQAISWLLSGERPEILDRPQPKKHKFVKDYVEEVLCYVDDEEVRCAVRLSVMQSRLLRYLVYEYKDVLDEERQARVRVLTRIIWYNLITL